ncbi:MAG TPA: co-chaperone GroES, partial [Vicinamibacterales bacterium]
MSCSEQPAPRMPCTLHDVSSFHPVSTGHTGARRLIPRPDLGTHMKVRPLHDRLIIQRLEEGEQTIGGIIVPDSAKEKPQRGKVFAVGQGKVRDDGSRQ